ncbi:two-component system alkaline phosphatase synthesis response regulator PhoP [Methanohalophilus levihalophilus]|uniref:response regulator n=1 Tax=Methanohalophilus levihalophilus TaxID=1431282 RepID=UPI001AE7B220|nr:response regulator [Methanohalophilus levihalophilus]MBP2031283.1 two-component system alkaline phosphatase synthesis response regulator PhoP [Methanohalophilus levihalophilus]
MQHNELDRKILKILEQRDASSKEIAAELGVDESLIQQRLNKLADNRQAIMIVDDEPDALLATQRALEADGYNVIVARSGLEALEKMEETIPDTILLDVMMPDMDGFEVCRRLKENKRLKHIPVIMLTAKGQTDDKVEGIELGADDYITKPFELRELKARIKMVLRRTGQ